jgi:hypothetical protein
MQTVTAHSATELVLTANAASNNTVGHCDQDLDVYVEEEEVVVKRRYHIA